MSLRSRLLAILIGTSSATALAAQQPCRLGTPPDSLIVPRAGIAGPLTTEPTAAMWRSAALGHLSHDCTKTINYPDLVTDVRAFWTATDLYFLFSAPYRKLNLFLPAQGAGDRDKLWDRDVVEIFLGADWKNINRYHEFEIAPTGDHVDLNIEYDLKHYDQSWESHWETAARIDEASHRWYAAARIPLAALSDEAPRAGTRWRMNLYRIDGEGPDSLRRFLCWRSTCVTNRDPNHVPEAFGILVFGKAGVGDQGSGVRVSTSGSVSYQSNCARCHGTDGAGGERGPDILHSTTARARSEQSLRELIRTGVAAAGMPAFTLPPADVWALASYVRALIAPAAEHPTVGDTVAGERFFTGRGACSSCHMVRGQGGISGPDLTELALRQTAAEIEQKLDRPPMPPLQASDVERRDLLAYLTRLARAGHASASWSPLTGPSFGEIVTPKSGAWPTYHGLLSGNRHSPLDLINRENVASMRPQWMFPVTGAGPLEVTPVVVDGVMYVTTANQVTALDAATGLRIWQYARPRTPRLVGDAAGGINRGVAILGDRLFLVTDNAHLLSIQRATGGLVWETVMADSRQHYGATSAPLVVKDLVISGTSGGDEGARGFVAAYRASSGEEVWRFRVAPAPGEPAAETWVGRALAHGCGAAWLTGTYDPETDLLFWTTGNPCPDYNGDERKGDNLYTSSVLALKPESGKLAWYYQFTPHDLHDWDGAQTPMVVDAPFGGRDRKLLLQASRNGFFYVLDRTDGSLLLAKPFVKNLTWATGVGADGRPQLTPGAEPSEEGTRACPAVEGATNWMSSAFNPATGLFYVMALEKCNIYSKSSAWWEPGKSFYGGSTRDIPGEPGQKYLRAIDIQTGKIAWEYPQAGPADSWGGVLSTAGGVVIFGEDGGALAAADATSGSPLWHFLTNQKWKASPMTYLAGGKQYIAVAAGPDIIAFGLPSADNILGSVAGTWNVIAMMGPRDSVVATYQMTATATREGWNVMLPNRPTLPLRVVAAGADSIVTELGPFASILRQGQMVTTRTVWRYRGEALTGRIQAVFSSGDTLNEKATASRRLP